MRVVAGVIALVVLCGSQAMAQEVSWGVKGGVNLATLSSDQDPGPDFNYRIGLVAGGFFTWPLGSRFDVQPEFAVQPAGRDARQTGVNSTISTTTSPSPCSCDTSPGPRAVDWCFLRGHRSGSN